MSNMYGMVLARYVANPKVKETGVFGSKPLVVFTSEEVCNKMAIFVSVKHLKLKANGMQAHYSCKKGAHWLGIGTDNIVTVRTDLRGRMLATDLAEKIRSVQLSGREAFFVNTTAGTTVQGSFDNLEAIADVCEEHSIWMHVDACLGGSVILSEMHKHLLTGISRANSIAWNPHKSLGVPLQCSMFLIRQKGLLHACNSTQAQYLFQQDKFYDVSYDTGDKSVQCGRKVDVFKFWLMLRARGMAGLGQRMDKTIGLNRYLFSECSRRKGFRLVLGDEGGPFDFTNVCFWYIPQSMQEQPETEKWWSKLYEVAPAIKERMCKEGTMMVGYSPLPHKGIGNFLRMTLSCFPETNETQIDFLLDEIERLGEQIKFDKK